MKYTLLKILAFSVMSLASVAAYSSNLNCYDLTVDDVIVLDNKLVVTFSSASGNYGDCRAAYKYASNGNFESYLSVFLTAKATGKRIHFNHKGGTSLRGLVGTTFPDYWAREINFLKLD